MRMKLNTMLTVLIPLFCIGLFSTWMYYAQPSMIFYPYPELEATPSEWGFPYEDVSLAAKDGTRLHGWYIPNPASSRVLLFFHGNAGNISHRGESVRIFHRLGFNILIFDYRGYGRSQGKPDEAGLYQDAMAAWQYLTRTRGIAGSNIVIFGRSLGGVVATWLASRVTAQALIVESTFSSARDVSRAIYPVMSWLIPVRFKLDAGRYIRAVKCPVLVLHSPDDEIIPFSLGEKLYRAENEPKQLVRLHGDHNAGFLISQPEYENTLAQFIGSLPR